MRRPPFEGHQEPPSERAAMFPSTGMPALWPAIFDSGKSRLGSIYDPIFPILLNGPFGALTVSFLVAKQKRMADDLDRLKSESKDGNSFQTHDPVQVRKAARMDAADALGADALNVLRRGKIRARIVHKSNCDCGDC